METEALLLLLSQTRVKAEQRERREADVSRLQCCVKAQKERERKERATVRREREPRDGRTTLT